MSRECQWCDTFAVKSARSPKHSGNGTPGLRDVMHRRLKLNFALLSAMAAERLSHGDNQLIEELRARAELDGLTCTTDGGTRCTMLCLYPPIHLYVPTYLPTYLPLPNCIHP